MTSPHHTASHAPAVSVVLPVRNGMPYLVEAVESILHQTFTDFEFLIIDDASTDDTPAYLRSLADARVRVITHEQSRGVAESLNHGIALASAPLIARQDADDVSELHRLARQVEWMNAHPECVVLGSQVEKIDSNSKLLEHFPRPTSAAELNRYFAIHSNPFTHGSVMMRRDRALAVGGYRGRIRYAEDYDLWLRLDGPGALINHPETLYRYRIHDQQICVQKYDDSSADCWLSQVLHVERLCTGEEDSLTTLDDRQLAAIKQRGLWKPRGRWSRRVRVLKEYARLLDKDSPRRAVLVRLLLMGGGW